MKLKCLFTISLLLIAVGCSMSTSQEENDPLQIGLMPTMDSIAIATAYELGLFEAHGVEVELIPFSSAHDRDAAFQVGALDGATVDLIAVGLFNEGGFPIRATSVTTAHFTLIGQQNYQNIKDLTNKTVLISNNTAIDFVLDQMLVNYGLAHDQINRVEVGNIPARFEMVRAGNADAALISEPFATMAVADGLSVISDTFQIDFNPFVLAFSLETIETRSDELRAFYQAYNQAITYLNNEPTIATLNAAFDLIGFPDGFVNYVSLPTFLHSQLPKPAVVATAHNWLITRGLISADTDIATFTDEIE